MFSKVLVANRGEIACRIIRSVKSLGLTAVAVYSDADADSEHVALADQAVNIGPAPARDSYLNIERILEVIQEYEVDAVHPGYGFLSENVEFSRACAAMGVAFVGPAVEHILEFGLKHRARVLAEKAGVPLIPGSELLSDVAEAQREAERVGYPVMLKSTAGGGGIGMRVCADASELSEAFESIKRLGKNNFKDDGVFLEKYIAVSRHIEVQIFGDGAGNIVVLGERDCSLQRRNQKVVEETPAPGISSAVRTALHEAARKLGEMVAYRSAGTVEFIYDTETEEFYFLEVNTRLQVEHGVTEEVFGVDIVRWMLELAAGENPLNGIGELKPVGCALELRVYAEDPGKNYQPSSGTVTSAVFPEGIRIDKWIDTGSEVSSFYDPLLAKIIVKAPTREELLAAARQALAQTAIAGFETNLLLLRQICELEAFAAGKVYTRLLDSVEYIANTFEVLQPGTQTTVQDFPGRVGYWGVGVPPSGPMDSLSFQIANKIVGNNPTAAALEMTLTGGEFSFNTPAVIALCGAEAEVTVGGCPVAMGTAIAVAAGEVVRIGNFTRGQRLYLAVRGGIAVPEYMGSRSTFTLGRFGGHGGRALMAGDVLHIGSDCAELPAEATGDMQTPLTSDWEIGVMYGPHGAPDFFTDKDIKVFLEHEWEVHFNSSRTGVRLIGPKPEWARSDGGEAGLHPSNIHDNAYAIGAVDFTGDMPVILGPDGPSLGGFVCPVTIVDAELWKVGQLRAGDKIRFIPITIEAATERSAAIDRFIDGGGSLPELSAVAVTAVSPVVQVWNDGDEENRIVGRVAGDRYLLLEFGPPELDLELRFKVHAWTLKFMENAYTGIIDLTPGIRSLQLHYDPAIMPRDRLLEIISGLVEELNKDCTTEVDSRIVYLPLSWDDPQTRLAIEKYTSSVRKDAPWCPSNIEFIRRINGLESVEQVEEILFSASYIVMGLGDVYLGAPVATPVDPRKRLVTTKYNPARTWTPENAVGIGGAYLCVYGMEGPGGYQFVGRTVQMWNRYHVTREFEKGKPWLLRPFDQIRFYPVGAEELLQMRRDFLKGRFSLRIEETKFDISEYREFLQENRDSIAEFKNRQQAAFAQEYKHWVDNNLLTFEEEVLDAEREEEELVAGAVPVAATVAGCVWKYNVKLGDMVQEGDEVVVLESMKTEIGLKAGCSGEVVQLCSKSGDTIAQGQVVCGIMPVA